MAFAMRGIIEGIDWQDGDMVILNDPYMGGTHLPDVTVIAPVYIDRELYGFVANRAHHADIGADVHTDVHAGAEGEAVGISLNVIAAFCVIEQMFDVL